MTARVLKVCAKDLILEWHLSAQSAGLRGSSKPQQEAGRIALG